MAKEPMIHLNRESLGDYLKRRRESLLVPVQDIAQHAGSMKTFIEALEENDYDAFNQRAQAQSLVKKYAVFLKMDEADVLQRFDSQWQDYANKRGFPKLSAFDDKEPSPPKAALTDRIKLPEIWHMPKIPTWRPDIGRLPGIPTFRPKFSLPIMAAIFLVGLFLLIDLPFSKQKPEPPPDPRFSEPQHKEPVAAIPSTPPPASEANADTTPSETVKAKEDIPPVPQTKYGQLSVESKNVKVIANSDTKRYHLPGMKYYGKIKEYHRVVFQSEREAVKAGYRKARE